MGRCRRKSWISDRRAKGRDHKNETRDGRIREADIPNAPKDPKEAGHQVAGSVVKQE